MGIVYLAALIIGLGTIGLQFILSQVGGGDGGHDVGGHDGELDADGELDGGDHGDADGGLVGAAALFLSMRFWTFGLMAFGIVGAALHYLDLAGFVTALVLSSALGIGSGLLASWLFRNLTKGVTSAETSADAVGQLARVLVPVSPTSPGKVRIKIKGKVIDMIATTDSELVEGQEVLVVEMRDTAAHVEAAPTGSREN